MFCRKCGEEIPKDSKFCFKCGDEVILTSESPIPNDPEGLENREGGEQELTQEKLVSQQNVDGAKKKRFSSSHKVVCTTLILLSPVVAYFHYPVSRVC